MSFLLFIFECFYFFLPAYAANMAPVLSRNWFLFLAKPVDFNIRLGGRPLLGKNKTWRGLLIAPVFAIVVVLLQRYLFLNYFFMEQLSLVDYSVVNVWLFGFLLGFGAIFGDLFFSFLKRRKGISPGKSWVPFDQLDFVLGGLLFVNFYFWTGWVVTLYVLVLSFFLHLVFKKVGFALKLEERQ